MAIEWPRPLASGRGPEEQYEAPVQRVRLRLKDPEDAYDAREVTSRALSKLGMGGPALGSSQPPNEVRKRDLIAIKPMKPASKCLNITYFT